MTDVNSADVFVTHVMQRLLQDREQTVSELWNRYFRRMALLARSKLTGAVVSARDEEDIALSAFKSFCIGLEKGRFFLNEDQDDLWPLLVAMTVRKTIDYMRSENRQKRGGPKQNTDERDIPQRVSSAVEELLAREPSAELNVIAEDSLHTLFKALDNCGDPSLARIATFRLEDQSIEQIATQLNCSERTVQRKLKTILAIWQALDDFDSE